MKYSKTNCSTGKLEEQIHWDILSIINYRKAKNQNFVSAITIVHVNIGSKCRRVVNLIKAEKAKELEEGGGSKREYLFSATTK